MGVAGGTLGCSISSNVPEGQGKLQGKITPPSGFSRVISRQSELNSRLVVLLESASSKLAGLIPSAPEQNVASKGEQHHSEGEILDNINKQLDEAMIYIERLNEVIEDVVV